MADAEQNLQFGTPAESEPATAKQEELIAHLRKSYDAKQLTDLQCLQLSRRHEVESNPIKSLDAGVEAYFTARAKIPDLNWETVLEKEEQWQKDLPAFGYGQDKDGHPVFYLQLSKLNQDALKTDMESAQKFYCRLYERLFHFNQQRTEKTGVLQYQCVFVLDFSGVSMWSAMGQIGTLKGLTSDLSALYPETAVKTCLINCPTMISMIINAVKPLLGTRTKQKISSSSDASPLKEIVWDSQRPEIFGGTSKAPIKYLDYTAVEQSA